jgi:hypothetical protein
VAGAVKNYGVSLLNGLASCPAIKSQAPTDHASPTGTHKHQCINDLNHTQYLKHYTRSCYFPIRGAKELGPLPMNQKFLQNSAKIPTQEEFFLSFAKASNINTISQK